MIKIFYLILFEFVILFACLTFDCNGIKVLENTTKEIVNKGTKNKDTIKKSIKSNIQNVKNEDITKSPTGNGLSSTGPVIYPDDDDINDHQTESTDKSLNQQNKKSEVKFKPSENLEPPSYINNQNNNKNVWVANNNSNSVHNKKITYSNDLTVTSPEIIQIITSDNGNNVNGKDATIRDGKVVRDFVPSPELKMPLTEEILHQNYMNDRTRLQNHQKSSAQLIQSANQPGFGGDSFQPLSDNWNKEKDKFIVLTTSTTVQPRIQPITTSYNTNYNQHELQQYQTQQYQNLQLHPTTTIVTPTASTNNFNGRSNFLNHDTQNINNNPNGDLPIYQKSGSTKKYYPLKTETLSNENLNSEKSSGDTYQTSGNQYVRNEVTWPIKDKDYIRVQPQTVPEYLSSGGNTDGLNNVNWNGQTNQQQQQQQQSHQHSINVQSQYQIHEEELNNGEQEQENRQHPPLNDQHNTHQSNFQHHHFNPPPNTGPSNIISYQYQPQYPPIPENIDHHHHQQQQHHHHQHQSPQIPTENIPSGLGKYKNVATHPYKFEKISEQDLKWEDGGHREHSGFLNSNFGGGNIRHPIFDALHHHHPHNHHAVGGPIIPIHLPKQYESEVIQSNEDGTISVKGVGPPLPQHLPHHNHHQHYDHPNGDHYGDHGDHIDGHHFEDNIDSYHYGNNEHHQNGAGGIKASKYLYFKKIASIIAGIIPIGLLVSALTPNYVVINPNATTLNSPVAPFTLVQAKTNRHRFFKKLDEEQQKQQEQQQQQHPHLGVIPIVLDNKALNTTSTTFITTPLTISPGITESTTTTTENSIVIHSNDKKKKMNYLKLRKKFSTTELPLLTKTTKSALSSTSASQYFTITQSDNSRCIERSICELAAGNKNPQLLKSLLEELQRKYRSEVIENYNRRSTLTLKKIPMTLESWESPSSSTSSILSSISSLVATAAAAQQTQSKSKLSEVDLQTSSSISSLYRENNQRKKNNKNKSSFVSEDDFLRASKGVNCSNYICDELISK